MTDDDSTTQRTVGSERMLAVLRELALHPNGIALDDLATRLGAPKPTIHHVLSTLKRTRFAVQGARGVYMLGDEFLRLAFVNYRGRPEVARVEPLLRTLADHFGETTHYAVLDGQDVVYRHKVEPSEGAVRLASTVGGRVPAYRTAVGKVLLAATISTEDELEAWAGSPILVRKNPHTLSTVSALHEELERVREQGYAVDDEENEIGVNCLAVLLPTTDRAIAAVSISALTFRTPLAALVAEVDWVRSMVDATKTLDSI